MVATLASLEEGAPVARKNKFRGLIPAQAVDENEREHGAEVRERRGKRLVFSRLVLVAKSVY